MSLTDTEPTVDRRVVDLQAALIGAGFQGDFECGLGARHVASTDNSIYQVLPAAIAYPKTGKDVGVLMAAIGQVRTPLSLTARGGDTGTNGQSLNGGVILDFGRHMTGIGALDLKAGTVTVEPGVVLDQLNAFLAPHGLFFPPMVSTASRATIGGMIATDASGKGSRRYGKTSDYIVAMDVTFADGTEWRVEPMSCAQAQAIASGDGLVADLHREALRIVTDRAGLIREIFPRMNRGLTGYNLQKLYDAEADRFFLGYLLAGSEGTLALTRSVTLRIAAKPTAKALVVVRYSSFDGALRDVGRLLEADPVAVEILDDKVLGAARSDVVWTRVEALLGRAADAPVHAMNFIEFAELDAASVETGLSRLSQLLGAPAGSMIDVHVVRDRAVIAQLWSLREKSVGLLARLGGGRQGAPFIEDTAVPPERLADYVADLRKVLDRHGLQYGMFGHADVGCLHVRPLLDLRDPAQAALIRPLSDEVARLTRSYGGLLWGEHGKGFRGEYSPAFFGELYPELQRLKAVFDPRNLLNPGKLATPGDHGSLDRIDAVPLRGEYDRGVLGPYVDAFDRAIACNGNAACYSWNALDVMCPSYKATRDRAQSPKGRAALLRGWARLSSIPQPTREQTRELAAIEDAAVQSLSTCLACKACSTLCPVKVDVPTMKSRFLAHYYRDRRRPLRHRILASLEPLLGVACRVPTLANTITQTVVARHLLSAALGLVDLPRFSVARMGRSAPIATVGRLQALCAAERRNAVILVEDTFTSTFDGGLARSAAAFLRACGYDTFRLPARPNGKVLHVLGFRRRFEAVAAARLREVRMLSATGARLVGLDAATALMFTQEYAECGDGIEVGGLESLIAHGIAAGRIPRRERRADMGPCRLFSHCTETALRPDAASRWLEILEHFGLEATAAKTGCCGMAGLFGHEQEHVQMSRALFELSWAGAILQDGATMLATGFSCRSQTKRLAGFRPLHPIELLNKVIGDERRDLPIS